MKIKKLDIISVIFTCHLTVGPNHSQDRAMHGILNSTSLFVSCTLNCRLHNHRGACMHGFTNLHRIPWPKAAEHGEGILVLQFSSLPPLLPSSFHEATLHASQTWRHFCTTHLPFSFSADHDVPEQTKYCTTCTTFFFKLKFVNNCIIISK